MTEWVNTLWICVAIFLFSGWICGIIAEDQFYYYERRWYGIGVVCFIIAIVLGSISIHLACKSL